ncbi:AraC family transcriptional regulator [Aeoliella mucimassa]|uniref:Xylose operon regulatory protein n=1 Tax=Aeoliella mucimassa TaxID=2527972 RepID=A0A518AQ25_9BACT|nr:DNA-binding transcriptional regulator [Aeoliella mucimassa]QDU56813.1 Xylose operon regulatory protein [Aeoliella mucimassa]
MRKTRQVALLVETSRGYGRQVGLGVARFSSLHGPWSFLLNPGDFQQMLPEMGHWNGDGIICRLENEELEKAVIKADLPTIALDMNERQLDPNNPLSRVTNLSVDSDGVAKLAVDHLLERNHKHFGFVGVAGRIWSKNREEAFAKYIKQSGFKINIYEPPADSELHWELEREQLVEWLTTLPRPVAIMACNDVRGRQVLEACRMADLSVPKDVAVIGVDNDELFCELAYPTLTSVALNGVMGGYMAAEKLNSMMNRKGRLPRKGITIPVQAVRVVERESTNSYNIGDESVITALEYIHSTRGEKVSVADVANASGRPRRDIETRFRKAVGHTIAVELQNMRLDHAKRLLEETDFPIPEVAKMAGYSSASYMIQVFRRCLDMTPAKYRAGVRLLTVDSQQIES